MMSLRGQHLRRTTAAYPTAEHHLPSGRRAFGCGGFPGEVKECGERYLSKPPGQCAMSAGDDAGRGMMLGHRIGLQRPIS
jgi:hypothetical protein